jgi:enoyl-[acyl-carrier protein] reductase I
MGFLSGKRALIVGLASNRSIAWGVARAMHREGAELAFSYPNEKLGARVSKMAAECDSDIVLPCDVSSDEQIDDLFTALGKRWDGLDIIVHSVAFAPADQLAGDYLDCVNREGFRIAHDISSYSFAALAKAGRPLLQGRNGALLTMSYLGAVQTIPNYNVMGIAKASLEANVRYLAQSLGPQGIRVNAISAGPMGLPVKSPTWMVATTLSGWHRWKTRFCGNSVPFRVSPGVCAGCRFRPPGDRSGRRRRSR